MQPKATAKTI